MLYASKSPRINTRPLGDFFKYPQTLTLTTTENFCKGCDMENKKSDKSTASPPNSEHINLLMRWIDEKIPPLSPIYREVILDVLPDYLHYIQKAYNTQGDQRFANLSIANLLIFSIQEIFALYTYDHGLTLMQSFNDYIAQNLDID